MKATGPAKPTIFVLIEHVPDGDLQIAFVNREGVVVNVAEITIERQPSYDALTWYDRN